MLTELTKERLQRLYWQEEKSVPEIAKIFLANKHTIYKRMRRYQIPRRHWTESNFLVSKAKPQFRVKERLNSQEEKLKIAGIMLYWGEGAQRGPTVDFSNSNPKMIQLFLRFLRTICGVSESRLRVYLYHHGNPKEVDASKQFWNKITRIPLRQFSRPYIRRGNPHKSGRVMLNGLIHIRYSDKKLLQLIQRWIGEYHETVMNGAGTQVAKGGSL